VVLSIQRAMHCWRWHYLDHRPYYPTCRASAFRASSSLPPTLKLLHSTTIQCKTVTMADRLIFIVGHKFNWEQDKRETQQRGLLEIETFDS